MSHYTAPARHVQRERTPYEEHRDYILAVLARRCGWLDQSDREAILHDAYALFLEKQRTNRLDVGPMQPVQVRAYLTRTALNKAMDEGKRAGRRLSVSLDNDDLGVEPVDASGDLDERVMASLDSAVVREIVAELPERQETIVKLRYFFDRTPEEIQRYLGINERVYRREIERACRQIGQRLRLVRHGTYCQSLRSLILAYVMGVAGPRRTADARRHIASCPACASLVRELRLSAEATPALAAAR